MQQIHRKRPTRAKLSSQDEAKLKAQLNTTYSQDILLIAQHFGNQHAAYKAQITDITSSSLTIEWEYKTNMVQKDEMQFALRDFEGPLSVIQEVSDLVAEAAAALGKTEESKLVSDKKMLDKKRLVDFSFVLPSVNVMAGVVLGLLLLGYLAFVHKLHPWLQPVRLVVSQSTCYYIFVICIGLHVFEACAVCAVCELIKTFQPQQMSTKTQLQWTVGGVLFGMFCLHTFMAKVARQFALAEGMAARQR
ncbi:hypothetical protein IWW36_000323 [Coemansia brasiliensis]|uniref:DUF2470 domain-containing protein n=1 Tax=Coemansia brasiliensis TaxID=2650707 RepID=A0A9W8IDW4_9FUNG|nr:hypothetical protein IWW36_000323 [Coemansia brasiliensis]